MLVEVRIATACNKGNIVSTQSANTGLGHH